MIGEVLGWKFDHAEGIVTRDGVITEWPAGLNGGVTPSDADIVTWTAEYEAARPDMEAQRAVDDLRAAKAVAMWTADKLGVPRATARAEIIAIYKTLT